jgi:hypothetical protein
MTPQRFDTIATLQPIPAHRFQLSELSLATLPRGQVGTIVEIYTTQTDPHYLIEFSDRQGRAYALVTLQSQEFLLLRYDLAAA